MEIEPKAAYPTPGSAEFCFVTLESVEELLPILTQHNIDIPEGGVVTRTGATGSIKSIYFVIRMKILSRSVTICISTLPLSFASGEQQRQFTSL